MNTKKRPQSLSDSSDDEPLIKKVNRSTRDSKDILDDSSSESDIENYLQPINEIDLKSSFFDIQKPSNSTETPFDKIEKNILSGVSRLSDSDSDEDDNDNNQDSHNNPPSSQSTNIAKLNFKQLHEYKNKLETVKKHVEEYNNKKLIKQDKDDISDLLAAGEINKPSTSHDVSQSVDDDSDFDTCSEEDWEDVKEHAAIPKEGLQITVDMPQAIRKKKANDLLSSIKRRCNRIKKENQIYVHKVHLLCWIAHGNYVNSVINDQNILALALSLLPSQHSYPADRTDLSYLEQILKWYRNKIKLIEKESSSIDKESLYEIIEDQINKKAAHSKEVFVYIFIAILRSLGIQCRLILSFQVEPLRPSNSELYSLSSKVDEKVNSKETKTKNGHDKSSKTNKTKSETNIKSDKGKEILKKQSDDKTKIDSKIKTKNQANINSNKGKEISKKSSDDKTKIDSKNKGTVRKHENNQKQSKISEKHDKSTKLHSKALSTTEKNKQPETEIKRNKKGKSEQNNTVRDKKSVEKDKQISNKKDEPQIRILIQNKRSEQTDSSKTNDTTRKKKKEPETKSPGKLNVNDKKKITTVSSKMKVSLEKKIETKTLAQKLSLIGKKKLDTVRSTEKIPEDKSRKNKEDLKNNNKVAETVKSKFRTRSQSKIPQIDGLYDSDTSEQSTNEGPSVKLRKTNNSNPSKPNLLKLKQSRQNTNKTVDTKKSIINRDSENDFSPPKQLPKKEKSVVNLAKLKSLDTKSKNSTRERKINSRKTVDVRKDIMNLINVRIDEQKQLDVSRKVNKRKSAGDSDDSDYIPQAIKKKHHDSDDEFVPKVRVKRRIPIKNVDISNVNTNKKKKGVDVWVEVFLETEEKWISVDVIQGQIHCVNELHKRATVPVCYVVAWNNNNSIKDITARYCKNFNTITRKLRIDQKWWQETLKPYIGKQTARDREEDDDLAQQQLDKPLPTTVSEYKNHPLYVLKRHLLKFEAIYPENAAILGFVRKEPVYSRQCVYTLHSRDIWLKHAKVVKPGENPYKIVKARPKYDKLSNSIITDQLLEIFGPWQVNDYEPPTAENGIVPKNAFGNVDLFKPSMLPKKTVHLQLPGLHKIARRMNIDCASAIIGFDFHGGWSHPVYDGYIVCEEFADILIAAWELEQEEIVKKEKEKVEKRVYGNWKKLIKGLLIRERLKARYNFGVPSSNKTSKKGKNKNMTVSDSESE